MGLFLLTFVYFGLNEIHHRITRLRIIAIACACPGIKALYNSDSESIECSQKDYHTERFSHAFTRCDALVSVKDLDRITAPSFHKCLKARHDSQPTKVYITLQAARRARLLLLVIVNFNFVTAYEEVIKAREAARILPSFSNIA